MDGSDRIVSMIYIRKYILSMITYCFITGKSISKYMGHIKERIADFGAFKEEARGIEITCNTTKSIISMNPYENLQSEKTIIDNKSIFLIDNRQNLCEHGGLHPITARKGKYIPGNVYISMKETFIKNGNLRVCWDLIQVKKSLISLTMTYHIAI